MVAFGYPLTLDEEIKILSKRAWVARKAHKTALLRQRKRIARKK
jgi:hypothetical protein